MGLTITVYLTEEEHHKLVDEIMVYFKSENPSQAVAKLIRDWKKPLLSL